MKFNDTTNKNGLIQDCEGLLGFEDGAISGDATLLKQFTSFINIYYQKAVTWIWQSDSLWEYDDANKTTLPIATTTLKVGQKDYELPTNAQRLDRVSVMDSNGDYQLLTPIDKSQVKEDMDELYSTNGMPVCYDKIGRSIRIFPAAAAANVTLATGLKLEVSRDVDLFTSADTIKEPGFNENFHSILSVGGSKRYTIGNNLSKKKASLSEELKELKSDLQEFYGSRDRDMPARILPKTFSNI